MSVVLHEPTAKPNGPRPATGAPNRARQAAGAPAAWDLAERFAAVARALLAEPSVEGVLGRLCGVAVEVVPGCELASTSTVRGRRIETLAATADVPRRADAIQYDTDEGPCLDAIRQGEVVATGGLASEARWPRFATRAASETGVRSVMSLPLYAGADTYGALNLYSRRPDAFDDHHSRALAGVLAAHGAVALAGAKAHEDRENLRRAVESRDVIGQAKGVLMHKRRVTAEQAFELLVHTSQHLNRRLREVAEQIVQTGSDPTEFGHS